MNSESNLFPIGVQISPLYGDKKAGLRKRVNDFCKGCIYDNSDAGNWRQQVQACTIIKCPLWDVRPISKPHKEKDND